MIPTLQKTLGIKKKDIFYATVHMDESFPHMHFAFLPMKYGYKVNKSKLKKKGQLVFDENGEQVYREVNVGQNNYVVPDNTIYRTSINDKGQEVYIINDDLPRNPSIPDEQATGCTTMRYDRPFLIDFFKNLEIGMKEQGIEANIANGRGHYFDVNKLTHQQREEMVLNDNIRIALEQEITILKQRQAELEQKLKETTSKSNALEKENTTLVLERNILKEEKEKLVDEVLLTEDMLRRINEELTRKQTQLEKIIKEINSYIASIPKLVVNTLKNALRVFKGEWNTATANKIQKETKKEIANTIDNQMNQISKQLQAIHNRDDQFELTDQQKNFVIKGVIKIAKSYEEKYPKLSNLFANNDDIQALLFESYVNDLRRKEKAKLEGDTELDNALTGQKMRRNAFHYVMNAIKVDAPSLSAHTKWIFNNAYNEYDENDFERDIER